MHLGMERDVETPEVVGLSEAERNEDRPDRRALDDVWNGGRNARSKIGLRSVHRDVSHQRPSGNDDVAESEGEVGALVRVARQRDLKAPQPRSRSGPDL